MASAQDYAQWIVQNQDKQGTPEFDTVAKAYQVAKQQPAAPAPQEDPGVFQSGVIGAGRSLDRVYKGLKQAALTGVATTGDLQLAGIPIPMPKAAQDYAQSELARMQGEETDNSRIYAGLQKQHPVATMVGETVPYLAAPVGSGYGGMAAVGAATGALEYGTPAEKALRAGAGAAGGALGNFIGNRIAGRAAVPSAMPAEQQALVDKAMAMGYDLSPAQQTGKTWQRNLEAAMAQLPSTSGREQQRAAGNAARSNQIAQDALDKAGGWISQDEAGASALGGFNQGLSSELGKTGAGYRSLLNDVQVPTDSMRPSLEALLAKQATLPEDQRGGTAALRNMLGTPNYQPPVRTGPSRAVNTQSDDIVAAIRKIGGINPADEGVGSLAQSLPFGPHPTGPVWTAQKFGGASNRTNTVAGHSLDEATSKLYQQGYLSADGREGMDQLIDKLADQSRGVDQHFSAYREPVANDPLTSALTRLTDRLDSNAAPKQEAGFLRDNPVIPGNTAQELRSSYGSSAYDSTGQAAKVYSGMRDAVDSAIESALPADKQGQFKALNQRYGLDMTVKSMSPKNQDTFLSSLYRGDPDRFYTFLGMAPDGEFSKVARGFLSRIVDKASPNGTVNASALGREIGRTDPAALQYLGGDAGKTLADVGSVGRFVLPESVGNSGTAQRGLYQQLLLNGGGLLGGSVVGQQQYGPAGGVAGGAGGALTGFLLPKAAQTAYLSKAMRPMLTGAESKGLLDLPPAVAERVKRYLGLLGAGGAAAAIP